MGLRFSDGQVMIIRRPLPGTDQIPFTTNILAIVAIGLSALSLGWQAAIWLLSRAFIKAFRTTGHVRVSGTAYSSRAGGRNRVTKVTVAPDGWRQGVRLLVGSLGPPGQGGDHIGGLFDGKPVGVDTQGADHGVF